MSLSLRWQHALMFVALHMALPSWPVGTQPGTEAHESSAGI